MRWATPWTSAVAFDHLSIHYTESDVFSSLCQIPATLQMYSTASLQTFSGTATRGSSSHLFLFLGRNFPLSFSQSSFNLCPGLLFLCYFFPKYLTLSLCKRQLNQIKSCWHQRVSLPLLLHLGMISVLHQLIHSHGSLSARGHLTLQEKVCSTISSRSDSKSLAESGGGAAISYPGHWRDVCVLRSEQQRCCAVGEAFSTLIADAESILEHLHHLPSFPPVSSKRNCFLIFGFS